MNGHNKILVVDDNTDNHTLLRNVLNGEYVVEEANNGRDALDLLLVHPKRYQLIITDTDMPVMDGLELLAEIRNTVSLRELPVLVVTESEAPEKEEKALDLGAVDIVNRKSMDKVIKKRVDNIFRMNREPEYKNVMEEIVMKEIEKCSASLGICTCDSCLRDLMALTLNRLKPKYVNTEKGELMSKVNQLSYNSQIEILSTITAAAETIKKNPRHQNN